MRLVGLLGALALVALGNALVDTSSPVRSIHNRIRRNVDLHDWLTADQKAEIKKLDEAGKKAGMKAKVMEYYKELPEEQRTKWDEEYRQLCASWLKKVASEEELAELKALKAASDFDTLENKVKEYKGRLDETARTKVEEWETECRSLWMPKTSRKLRAVSAVFEDFTEWMTAEQKKEIAADKEAGKSFPDLREKTLSFLKALSEDKQKEIKEKAKARCKTYFTTLSNEDEIAEMKKLFEAGQESEMKKVADKVIARQDGTKKEEAKKYQQVCADVYGIGLSRKRRDMNTLVDKHLAWLDADQKKELKDMKAAGKSNAEIKAKVMSFLHGLDNTKKTETKENMRKSCYAWLEKAASKEEVDELHKLHETDHNACKTKVRVYIKRLPVAEQEEVNRNLEFCERIWYGDHDHGGHGGHGGHGSHGHDHAHKHHKRHLSAKHLEKYTTWLTAEQKTEIETLEAAGTEYEQILSKIKEFYGALPEDRQATVKTEFKEKCGAWVQDVATAEELAEVKKLHESGDFEALGAKLKDLYNRLDEHTRHEVEHVKGVCKKVWGWKETSRRRRHEHSIDEFLEKYLNWLSDDQKAALRELKDDKEAAYKKVLEFYGATSGDAKESATEGLKGACKHLIGHAIGEDNHAEIKKLVESGAAKDQVLAKLNEFVGQISDDATKEKTKKTIDNCKPIFETPKRMRRHEHSIDEFLEKYLNWLSDDQKAALRELKDDKEAAYKKVLEFYGATSGDAKETATEGLKGACKHLIGHAIGEDKQAEIKKLVESGASKDQILAKLGEFVEQISDDATKEKTKKTIEKCKPIFGAPKRMRRHEHTLDEVLTNYLTWMDDTQKEAIKALKDDKEAMYKKVLEFYRETTGAVKETATSALQGACKHFIGSGIGADNSAEMKKLMESGASVDQMHAKALEFIDQIEDAATKEKLKKTAEGCKTVFVAPKRVRKHELSFEEKMDKYLGWMEDSEKEMINEIKEDKEAMYTKIMEFFDAATGDKKKSAAESLKGACKHYIGKAIGSDNTAEIKKLVESGASIDELGEKINGYIAEIADAETKAKAEKLSVGCKKIYAASKAQRKRREEHKNLSFEEIFERYLSWLTEEQKTALQAVKDDKPAMYKKVMEFYDVTEGESKTKATHELKGACKHFFKHTFGEQKAKEIKALKESGASLSTISDKIEEYVKGLKDVTKKAAAEGALFDCRRVFTNAETSRRVRDAHHTLESSLETFLSWLNDAQKDELKELKGDKKALYAKVLEYYEGVSDEVKPVATEKLKGACKHMITDVLGEEKSEELKKLRESGASFDQLEEKYKELVAGIEDEAKRTRSERASVVCKKVFTA